MRGEEEGLRKEKRERNERGYRGRKQNKESRAVRSLSKAEVVSEGARGSEERATDRCDVRRA